MKDKSKKIIKTLLLSATVALFHGSAKADTKKAPVLDLNLLNGNTTPNFSKGQQMVVKNMYKIMRSGEVKLIAAHRSHRSHSSHRSSRGGHYSHSSSSHYSHSSSSYGGGGGSYSSGSSSGSSSSSSLYTPKAKTAGDYTLGERTLASGIYGSDVDQLVRLLIKAGYSPDPAKLEKSGSYYMFTDDIVTAIKMFQACNGIPPDGKLNSATLTKLKSYK